MSRQRDSFNNAWHLTMPFNNGVNDGLLQNFRTSLAFSMAILDAEFEFVGIFDL